ncbi:MAG: hypothetical protein JXB30_15005 [Anaerolineae bacterium]|nr:hypothetical protein [Anaerolineae bacterium]
MTQTSETFSVPRSLLPPIVFTWLSRLARINLAGADQLGEPGTILQLRESHVPLFRAIYAHYLSERQGLFMPSPEDSNRDYIAYLTNRYDALIAIPADAVQAETAAHHTLGLARAADALIFPVGISITRQLQLPGETGAALPLPGAQIAVFIEAPFKTAEHPEQIPSSWNKAVMALLDHANAQAQEILQQGVSATE